MTDKPNEPTGHGRPFDATAYLSEVDAAGGRLDAVPTGFPSVDVLLSGGPRRGELVVLTGDAGSGKSALAMAIALRAAESGYGVAFFSGECGTERLYERALAMLGKATIEGLRRGTLDEVTHANVAAAAVMLRDRSPMFGHLPPNGVPGLSDLLIDHLGLDLVVIDAVPALVVGRGTRDEEVAFALAQLKALAVRRQCVVLAVAPLAAPVRGRDDTRPQLADIGFLGAPLHHGDTILGLYREELYRHSNDVDGAAEVHVLKQRDGSLGYADLFFYKAWLRFEDMIEE